MGRKWSIVLVLAGLAFVVALRLRNERHSGTGLGWPVNLAHRGASGLAPENTLEAFRLAVEAGAGGLELDVHLTRDGHVVVIHDPSADRTTSGSGAVAGVPLAGLRGMDAGHRFSPDGGRTYPYRGQGLRVPTLAEVLEEFPDVSVNIDIKDIRPGYEEAVIGTLRKTGAEGRTLVASKY